jgi:hypothetical protein
MGDNERRVRPGTHPGGESQSPEMPADRAERAPERVRPLGTGPSVALSA